MSKKYNHAQEGLLTEARESIPLNREEFYQTEKVITAAVKRGQHIYHILKINDLPVLKSSVYQYINKGYYTISNIDLPRAVKFKPRHSKASEFVPYWAKNSRTYNDFLEFVENNNITGFVEMDTVIGRVGGKVILTLHFNSFNFMVGILLDNKTVVQFFLCLTSADPVFGLLSPFSHTYFHPFSR